jgi:hypothetical protein
LKETATAARALGVRLQLLEVRGPDDSRPPRLGLMVPPSLLTRADDVIEK